jgi:hypothetical protein
MMLSAGLAAWGEDLLHHQCWAWGADVRRPEGNLLVQCGFERAAAGAARRYTLRRRDRLVVLWPFGMVYSASSRAHAPAIYVGRYNFDPRCITTESALSAWSSIQFDDIAADEVSKPRALEFLLGTVRWIESYERWVGHVAGPAYRDRTLLTWKSSTLCGYELLHGWKCLSRDLGGEMSRVADEVAA